MSSACCFIVSFRDRVWRRLHILSYGVSLYDRILVQSSVKIRSPAWRQLREVFARLRKLHHWLHVGIPPKVWTRLFKIRITSGFRNLFYDKWNVIFSRFAGHRHVLFNDRGNAATLTRVNWRRDRGRPRSIWRRHCRRKWRRRFLSKRRRWHWFKRSLSDRRWNGL